MSDSTVSFSFLLTIFSFRHDTTEIQTFRFLDNSLRGGIPTILGNVDDDTTYDEDPSVKVFHSFSRIHGDLERDYNAFKIDPTYFSQGPGNYRDVAQNRRNDVTFFPRMGSFDIQMFLSFIQADGYEPLTVEAVVYRFTDPNDAIEIAQELTADANSSKVLGNVLNGGPFRPGQIFQLCEQLNIMRNLKYSDSEFINMILEKSEDHAMAVFGTGYWADHWDYYIDLIDVSRNAVWFVFCFVFSLHRPLTPSIFLFTNDTGLRRDLPRRRGRNHVRQASSLFLLDRHRQAS